MTFRIAWIVCIALAIGYAHSAGAQESRAEASQSAALQPWMNPSLDPDTRADLMIHEMTLDEKIQLVHGVGWGVLRKGAPVPPADNGCPSPKFHPDRTYCAFLKIAKSPSEP
jgi:beta-glucosidase